MTHRKTLRLLALPAGAVALLLSCSAGGLSGDASTASPAGGAVAPNTGPFVPTGSATAGSDLTTHASRVDTTRPASIDAASPDPTGLSPSVEFSASEATPFECALDGVAFAECTSPRTAAGSSDGLDTFALGPTEDPTLAIDDVSTPEGNAGTVAAEFTVTLSAASATPVTVDYATASVSATSGTDFQSSSGTLTFDPGDTSEPINVPVNGDVVDEDDETFTVTLSTPVGAALGDDSGVGTIVDDDPTLSVSDVTVTEGNGGTDGAAFTVMLSAASSLLVSVDYATANVTATAGSDYTALAGTLNFAPGETSKTVTVTVQGDNLHETDETFTLELTNPSNGSFGDGTGVGTITNDDMAPKLSVDDVVVSEAGGSAVFTISRNRDSQLTVTVDAATSNDTATAASDYTALPTTTLTFVPGEMSETVTVPVTADSVDEPEETFFVNLSNPVIAANGDAQGIATIVDDDPSPTLSIDDRTVTEGTDATFTVTLSAAAEQTVTVNYASVAGTATSPADFDGIAGVLSFATGETSKTIQASTVDDALDEDSENYTIALSDPSNATFADSDGLGTITDNDALPALSIADVIVAEGAGNATFTVTMSPVSGRSVTVDYTTAPGSATAADYTTTSGTLTFAAGDTTETASIPITADGLDEIDEDFVVNLSNASNTTLADAQGAATITDDDGVPQLSVGDVTVAEGNGGAVNANFTVSLDVPSGLDLSVDYATANGSATAPADYAATGGTVEFSAGQTTRQVTVPVSGDVLDEDNETFTVELSGAANATIADGQGTGTISDDDEMSQLAINDVTVNEGNTGATNATFTVTLSPLSGREVTVDYATGNNTAAAPVDYAATSGTLTFAAGQTTKSVTVPVNGDFFDEGTEAYFVNLSNADSATIADIQGVGTILDDDGEPSLAIDDVIVAEGDTGFVSATFTVSLAPASGQTVSVGFATDNGTAAAPGDYAATGGNLVFTPGQMERTLTVQVNGDALDEEEENFRVNLSSAVNATITDDEGLGTITDNDPLPSLSVGDVAVVEGNSGIVNATFAVTLSVPSGQQVSVGWSTAPGTATTDVDYTSNGGNLVFTPGTISRTMTVQVRGDFADELDENFLVNLADPGNADIADGQGVGTITDDDGTPTIFIDDVAVAEGDTGTVNAAFTVRLNAPSGLPVTVAYATANGSATAPGDYDAATGALAFAPAETTKTITVPVHGDTAFELDETFLVNLSGAVNGTLVDAQALGTITNDDPAPPPPPAPTAPPPSSPPTPDTAAPGQITNVRVVNGDGSVTVTWRNPSDADFQRVSAVRIKAGAAAQNLPRYEGRGTTFTDRALKNGLLYRYRIRTYDGAGNVSAGVEVAALPKAALFGPPKGATITAPPTLRWKAVRGATYYNVQLYRVGRGGQAQAVTATKVLSAWPNGTSYKLRRTWPFDGKTYRLTAGSYRWYVWPGLAKRSAKKYGPMVGESSFTVKTKKKRR